MPNADPAGGSLLGDDKTTRSAAYLKVRRFKTSPESNSLSQALIRQHPAAGFYREGNDQQSDPKGNRGERNRLPESSHVSDQRADPEVDSRGNKASE